ncbi:MAG: penicillin-binding protein 2 [Thermomicrobiales bacterium]
MSTRRAARWPRYLLLTILLAAAIVTVAAIAPDAPDRLLDAAGINQNETNVKTPLAQSVDQALAPSTATVVPTATKPVLPTKTPKPPVAGAAQPSIVPTVDATATAPAPTSTAAPTAAPTQTPVVDSGSPPDVVQAYADRWSAGDYSGLYDLISSASQKTTKRQDFVDRYTGIATEAGLDSLKMTITSAPDLNGNVAFHVDMHSHLVGKISEDNRLHLLREEAGWRIEWTPSLMFKDLGDGCVDYRVDRIKRGSILDRNSKPLAYDGLVSQIGIIPGEITDEKAMLKSLSKLIGMKESDIKEKYKDGQPDWFMPLKDYPEDMDQHLLDGLSKLSGVAVRTKTARVYPLGAKAAHITGYITPVNADDLAADTTGALQDGQLLGRAGIEAGANDLLTGKLGGTLAVVDCTSRSDRTVIAKKDGVQAKDVVTTIDRDLQKAVDDALGAVQGSAVIVDPRTGEILAMASHPSFDPNWFILGFSDKDWTSINDEAKRPLLNRATQASYPTGSIFKVITMSAAMEDLGYEGASEFDCPQEWSIPGTDQIWKDWTVDEGVGAQGTLTLHNALVASCNTVFYQLGYQLDKKDENLLPDMAKAYGLGKATGIPFLPEIAGVVPDPKWKQEAMGDFWASGDAVNLSIGQGYFEATPLQMATAYAAIANGGTLLQPYIVEYTKDADGKSTRVAKRTVVRKLPVSRDHIREIQSAMRDQTSNKWGAGSVRVFGDYQWPIAGKTGTAQNELNKAGKPHAWFAAFGPYGGKATIASIVMVESVGEGVVYAAPITRQIYDYYLTTDLAKLNSG